MEWSWIMAGAGSAIICAIHVFAGGPTCAKPLLEARDIGSVAKYTNYYCWHVVSIALGVMAVMFAWAGLEPAQSGLGVVATMSATSFALWGLVLPKRVGQTYLDMPQGWLFLPIAVLGVFGFV